MKEVLFINTRREGYAVDQIYRTMTVGELIEYLQDFDEDTPIYLKNDNGYTYGGILESRIEDDYIEEEEEEEEEEE